MKKQIYKNNINGYIEGYYGKLLSWKSRGLIIESLSKSKMTTYFYAPKEDLKHRLNWREKYSAKWRKKFRIFTDFSRKNNIQVIAGIAPGLDFNFKNLDSDLENSCDFKFLYKKAKQLLDDGATSIALMLDDIPNDFEKKFGKKISEGKYHAILANKLLEELDQNIYFVPKIYADELIEEDPFYLLDLGKILNPKIKIFYCGKNVVSKSLINYNNIKKYFQNEIIVWDNYYANDYCPRRIFIGPHLGRQNIQNIMINATGLIKTDLLILDIFACNIKRSVSQNQWKKILINHGVPSVFMKIKKYFLKPDFGSTPKIQSFNFNNKHFEVLDFLLWKWKSELSREWYPFIFGLKLDLQINKKYLSSERITKTQTIPLSKFLNKGE